MKINELTRCPICKNDEFLTFNRGTKTYCGHCYSYLGKYNELGKKAEKAPDHPTEKGGE